MQKKKKISLRYRIIPLMLAAAALLCSCTDTPFEKSQETTGGGYEQSENSASDSLTVTARVSNGSARYAMPSPSISDFDYAALLYPDVNSSESTQTEVFVNGKRTNENKIQFSFQRPNKTTGITFTLEVFAFETDTDVADFSRGNALFSGKESGLAISDDSDEIEVTAPIALLSNKSGTVSLKVTVPNDCTLDIDDTAKLNFNCEKESENPNTYSITANEISARAYQVTFTVKKKVGESDEIIHVFSEYINVLNGLCTDTWSGQEKGEAKDITNSISKTVYVRGENAPWYTNNAPSATASDENSGSYLAPFATIQKAVDKIIAINDGSAYTICIDGKLTQSTGTVVTSMVRIAPDTNLKLKIESMSAGKEATLDAANNGRVMSISSDRGGIPTVTLKNIHITGGNTAENGGGVYVSGGTLTMDGGKISDCIATKNGGGVYITSNGTFNMSGTAKITECKTTSTDSTIGGGGIYSEGTLVITGGMISKCISANYGGGVFANGGTFTMSGSTKISGNEARIGGAVCIRMGTFTMKDGTIGGENEEDGNTATTSCGGVYAMGGGYFRMKGGTITGNNSYGVYINGGYFYMSGTAKVESNNIVYGNSSNPIYISGALTAESPVATLYLSSFEVDKIVLRADTGVEIDEDICNKIALTDEGCKIVPSEDGKTGVLKVHTIFLNSESGSDSKYGVNASSAVKTLSKAIEKYDTYNAEKIMVCAPYTLPSSESTLLNRTGEEHLTLMRYAGSSDGSGALTGNLLTVSQGNVDIVNTTLDGNKENVSTEGSLLYISGSTTTVSLGTDATLCNNKATGRSGGAVYIAEGTFEMRDGTITGNEALYGGGIMVFMCTLKMTGGAITGNKAREGGGVNNNASTFEMSGGTISGNTATLGSGVYQNGAFRMSSAAKVESDNDVYLVYNTTPITVEGMLTAESPVATITLSAYTADRQVLSKGTNTDAPDITQGICDQFAVTPDPDGNQWKVYPDSTAGVLQMTN